MATLVLKSSGWSKGTIRVTYTASNGTLRITEIEGKRGDGYRSWNETDTSISVSVGGTSKSISLSHYVDFGASGWVKWGAANVSWSGLTGDSIKISTKMQSGTPAYSGYTFSGNATMSWDTYTVSYNANGGSGAPSSQTKTHGTTLTLSSTKPTRSGYTFMGWGTSVSDTSVDYNAGGSYTANNNITLYAIWRKTITLTYNANGGSNAPSSQSANVYNSTTSNTFTLSSTKPTRNGYTFLGWSTSKTATSSSYSSGGSITLSSNSTLYAVWSEHKLTVNYYSNYATYAALKSEKINVSASTNVLLHSQDFYYDNYYSDGLANVQNVDYLYLSRSGYAPTGYWNTSSNGSGYNVDQNKSFSTGQALAQALGKTLVSGNASVNIYAQWQENAYTLSYDSNGGFGEINPQTVEWGATFNLSNNAFTREGYKFIGWNAYRNNDNTWYVIGQGWITEDEIITNGYSKKLYDNQSELTFDASWIIDNEEARLYTMYAVWEISGIVYIDNGTSFEPYLAYIDNGNDWELYLMYVDNGVDWNIIS